ncbi:MAG: formate C-acetyltransferase/glycerol dehydratase family glycyl radical enzyme [Eubacteriales bacterium]
MLVLKTDQSINIDIEHVLGKDSPEYRRGQRLRDRVINTKNYICIERARIATRAYREHESENIYSVRSRVFDAIMREMSLFILDDELIVGHQAEKQRSAPVFPEFAVEWIKEEIDIFDTRGQDKFIVPPEVKKEFLEEIYPYWKGKTFSDRMYSEMPDEIRLMRMDAQVYSPGLHEEGGLGHVLHDYAKIINEGLSGIKERVSQKIKELDQTDPASLSKKHFYDACVSMSDSAIHFAHRYSELAAKMAKEEKDSRRREELAEIARICAKVPEFPAESFYEALQSVWFMQLLVQIYDNAVSITPGRFDQFMYPLYTKDLLRGKLTKAKAQELLEAFWVKFTEPIKIYRAADAASHAGYPMGQNLCIGGVGRDGLDCTNDLSYRCLEAHCHMLLMQPNFSVRVHNKSPYIYFKKIAEAIRLGNGMPQVVNDDVFIPSLTNIGVALQDARDYAPVGCIENTPLDTWGRCNGGYFNLVKILELALGNGKCSITGKQVSPQTGDARNFSTFEEVLDAYEKQMDYAVRNSLAWNNTIDMVHSDKMPVPLTSILVGDCVEKGKDVTLGGAKYNWTAPLGIAIANVGNSLMGIKKAVFDDKICTMAQLVDTLENDFKDAEYLRLYLLNKVPHYGNDMPEVDRLAKYATDCFFDKLTGHKTFHGGVFVGSLVPVSSYVAFGEKTGATPDGRKSGEPLADGISPSNGTDLKGPTAVLKSVCTLDQFRCPNGVIFNLKLDPSPIQSEEGLAKFVDLIRTYIDLKGGHIQFNVVSAKTLKEAQNNPAKYKGLVVRVAGYSAFFNELSAEVQDSIIERSEHCLG